MDPEHAAVSPIFVVGMVRSGTTLISMMLSAHPAIAIAPDTHYVNAWVQRHRNLQLSQPADFDQFWSAFSGDKRFGYLGIDAGDVRHSIEVNQRYSFRGVYVSVLEAYAANLHKPRWGEKTPFSADHLDTLFSWFPEARVIYMIRDPRAVVSSLRQIPWLAEVGVAAHAAKWAKGVERALVSEGDPRMLFVHYEDLVHDPRTVIGEVCGFLGEAYSADMLDGRHSLEASTLIDREGWEKEHITAALGPVHEMSVAKWRQQLEPDEVDLIERYCGSVMVRVGYSPGGNELSPAALAPVVTQGPLS